MTKRSGKKSVIASIVLYNHQLAQVKPTIDSLLAEPLVDKIVLVDNANCEWANHLDNPRISYLKSSSNRGFGDGHNQAMHHYLEQSRYFIICNPDIVFSPRTVENLYSFAESGQHRFVTPKIIYPNGELQHACRLLPTPVNLIFRRFFPFLGKFLDKNYELKQAEYKSNFFTPTISGCFMFIESTLLKQLNGFDTHYFMYMEDTDLCHRALQYVEPIYCPEATVTHYFEKGSYKHLRLLKYHIISAIYYFNKWGWFFDRERRINNRKCLMQFQSLKIDKVTSE